MEKNNETKPSRIGRFLAYIFMTTLVLSISAIVIAMTYRIIAWMLF